jgi:hypothetical protein
MAVFYHFGHPTPYAYGGTGGKTTSLYGSWEQLGKGKEKTGWKGNKKNGKRAGEGQGRGRREGHERGTRERLAGWLDGEAG